MNKKDKKFYVKELLSEECQCEKSKKKGFAFCFTCYKKLPLEMQRNLFKKIDEGYAESYDSALKYLQEV